MKLYTTPNSPYGRIVRAVIIEKGLEERVPVEGAVTRQTDSPYYAINPSGRVPYLLLDDGTGLEDSGFICAYLDELDGESTLHAPAGAQGLAFRRIEATARSFVDGYSVWAREYLYRPAEIRSGTLIDHEKARAARLCDFFEAEIANPVLAGPVNMAQVILGCALHGRDASPPGFEWRDGRPKLSAWVDEFGERPSMARTVPVAKGTR